MKDNLGKRLDGRPKEEMEKDINAGENRAEIAEDNLVDAIMGFCMTNYYAKEKGYGLIDILRDYKHNQGIIIEDVIDYGDFALVISKEGEQFTVVFEMQCVPNILRNGNKNTAVNKSMIIKQDVITKCLKKHICILWVYPVIINGKIYDYKMKLLTPEELEKIVQTKPNFNITKDSTRPAYKLFVKDYDPHDWMSLCHPNTEDIIFMAKFLDTITSDDYVKKDYAVKWRILENGDYL